MSSLENLRKQAKQFLRWHRDGYYPVAEQIRAALPRFRKMTDREVLAHPFKLSDAQAVVARRSGFDNWHALKAGIDAMTNRNAVSPKPRLLTAEPQLFVTDIKSSCDFFNTKLGFTTVFVYGEPPFYAQVKRDGAALNLRHVDALLVDPTLLARADYLGASITVVDVKSLYLEFQAAGAPFHQAMRKKPWGVTTFIVKDPDGNLILFSGP